MRNPKIKLSIKTEKQLNALIECNICKTKIEYKNLYFYVDESNYSITKNAKGICINCKLKQKQKL
jgi:Asp-tRNA(Asn)/Glu-tRNA(Gln) amidotransferase B subunit